MRPLDIMKGAQVTNLDQNDLLRRRLIFRAGITLRSLIKKFAAAASGRRTYLEDATDKDFSFSAVQAYRSPSLSLPLLLSPPPLPPLSLSLSLSA